MAKQKPISGNLPAGEQIGTKILQINTQHIFPCYSNIMHDGSYFMNAGVHIEAFPEA